MQCLTHPGLQQGSVRVSPGSQSPRLALRATSSGGSSSPVSRQRFNPQHRPLRLVSTAALGSSDDEDKKAIVREQEPDEFWQSKAEAKGANPMKDPLAIIGIASILLPFLILGLAIGTGFVDLGKTRMR
ncbi:hypothetical protein WJX74_006260 [Apatococcus lobatus]|uniref:Uncharacterized protein n=1 Tax=Apatococcus lobatus TaxID=904363 RepID=A0AAW1QUZ4_9CHLO